MLGGLATGRWRGHSEFGERVSPLPWYAGASVLLAATVEAGDIVVDVRLPRHTGTPSLWGGTCGWDGDLRSGGHGLKPFPRDA